MSNQYRLTGEAARYFPTKIQYKVAKKKPGLFARWNWEWTFETKEDAIAFIETAINADKIDEVYSS